MFIKQFPEVMISHFSFINRILVFTLEQRSGASFSDEKEQLSAVSLALLPAFTSLSFFSTPTSLDPISSFPSAPMAFFRRISLQHQRKYSWRGTEQPSSPFLCPKTWPTLLGSFHLSCSVKPTGMRILPLQAEYWTT